MMSNWCLTARDSAATAPTPPGRASRTSVTSRWTNRMNSSLIRRRTLTLQGRCASLPLPHDLLAELAFRHTHLRWRLEARRSGRDKESHFRTKVLSQNAGSAEGRHSTMRWSRGALRAAATSQPPLARRNVPPLLLCNQEHRNRCDGICGRARVQRQPRKSALPSGTPRWRSRLYAVVVWKKKFGSVNPSR